MIKVFAIGNYRSLKNIVAPMGGLNLVTGANGTGKSNLYKALRLLSDVAKGNLIATLASEGGLGYTFWAGPDSFSKDMKAGNAPIQGNARKASARLHFGFVTEGLGYSISLGLPPPPEGPDPTMFHLDPEIKRECIWAGDYYRPAACLVDRAGPMVRVRVGKKWQVYSQHLNTYESMLSEIGDPIATPEIHQIRHIIRSWRFYDQFRTDAQSIIRTPQIGTRTPVLDQDGHNLVAALRTIYEIGDREAMFEAIADAFPGGSIDFNADNENRFSLEFFQQGLLRPLKQAELSDGTLRYLLLIAALLTPRPPSLMVLNEPETSLHPDLLPALGRLISKVAKHTQVWVVSHASRLIANLEDNMDCNCIHIAKELGETHISGQGLLDAPPWHWPN